MKSQSTHHIDTKKATYAAVLTESSSGNNTHREDNGWVLPSGRSSASNSYENISHVDNHRDDNHVDNSYTEDNIPHNEHANGNHIKEAADVREFTTGAPIEGPCLVIGGTGWVGSFLTKHLSNIFASAKGTIADDKREEFIVHVADINPPRDELKHIHSSNPNIRFHPMDISSFNSVSRIIHEIKPKVVFHLASMIDLRVCPSPVLYSVNVTGTENVIRAIQTIDDGRTSGMPTTRYLVYTSTIDVACVPHQGCEHVTEADGYSKKSPTNYEVTKVEAEKMVLAANRNGNNGYCTTNLITIALRPGHVFGIFDPVIPTMEAVPPIAVGPSWSRMSMVYVENIAIAHIHSYYLLLQQYDRRRQAKIENGEDIGGKPFFITDFDANFCDFYFSLIGKKSSKWIRFPALLVRIVIIICDILQVLMWRLFSVNYFHPMTGVSSGTFMPCVHVTADSRLAHKVLHYKDNGIEVIQSGKVNGSGSDIANDKFWMEKGLPRLFGKEEAIQKTIAWAKER
jgi:nucleoside-diphosphate-sugar epimerase